LIKNKKASAVGLKGVSKSKKEKNQEGAARIGQTSKAQNDTCPRKQALQKKEKK